MRTAKIGFMNEDCEVVVISFGFVLDQKFNHYNDDRKNIAVSGKDTAMYNKFSI